jgi:anti-sigma regulatory factor (Ser/Thr protein kinase)
MRVPLRHGRVLGRILLATDLTEERDVRLFRRELRHALGDADTRSERLDDFVLAVNEAVANVFRHAYPPGVPGSCHVAVARTDDSIIAIVEDDGDQFDPRRGYEELAADESGRGFMIIRSLVDDFVCDVTDGGGGHIELRLGIP